MEKKKVKISGWSKEADYRIKNHKWLKYSGKIALRIMAAMEDIPDMNQAALAKAIGVTPQYISKLLKGHQNLSLETIAKISEALGVELISFPVYKYMLPIYQPDEKHKLDDAQDIAIDLPAEQIAGSTILSTVDDDEIHHFRIAFKKIDVENAVQASI